MKLSNLFFFYSTICTHAPGHWQKPITAQITHYLQICSAHFESYILISLLRKKHFESVQYSDTTYVSIFWRLNALRKNRDRTAVSSYIWEQWIEWVRAGPNLQVKVEHVKYNRLPPSRCLIGLCWIQNYFHNENCVSLSAVSELPFNLSYVPPALSQPQMWIYSHFSEISSNLWYLRSNSCLQWHLWELKHVETVVPKIKKKKKKKKKTKGNVHHSSLLKTSGKK